MKSVAVLTALLALQTEAFVPSASFKTSSATVTKPSHLSPVFMATEKDAVAGITAEDEDCVPEDEYCAVDSKTGKLVKLTVQEKERIFLDALQAYYATGRQVMPDDEFDLLKEDLQWNGSDVIQMNRKEATYLAAVQAYLKGTPTLNDKEFDDLKNELKEAGSKFASSKEPKCLIETGICSVTFQEDQFRSNLLYVPAVAVFTSVWLGPVFEIFAAFIFRFNPLVFLLLGAPLIYFGSKFITEELLFENNLIAYGPCPSCEVENRVYFGDVLKVEGFSDVASAKCPNCKTVFQVQKASLRASTLPKD